jgi:hypothetical protein
MTYAEIISALRIQFGDYRYPVTNTYIFRHDWESDFFCLSKQGYAVEVEVKVSYSDFLADFRKQSKHRALDRYKTGYVIDRTGLRTEYPGDGLRTESNGIRVQKITEARVPNRFYYACPVDIIPLDKVPHYAGLIYVQSRAMIMKTAPFLHKGTVDYTRTLLDKYYYRSLKLEREVMIMRSELEERRRIMKEHL